MILSSVTHHIESNTLEAIWLELKTDAEGNPASYERVKCQSYNAEQRAEFIALVGKNLTSFERTLLTYVSSVNGYSSRFVPKPVGVKVNFGSFNYENYFGFLGAPNAKGYGTLVEDIPTEESLILNNQYTIYETSYTLVGGGKYATLL